MKIESQLEDGLWTSKRKLYEDQYVSGTDCLREINSLPKGILTQVRVV